jgi:hypothetical protein
MYPKDAPVKPVKLSPVNIYLYIRLLISVSPKQFKFTYMEMKIYEDTFPPNEDLQTLGILSTSYIIPHTTLGNE